MIWRHDNYYTQCEQLLAKVILTIQEVHVPNMRENMQKSRIVSFNNSFRTIIKFHFHACDEERNGFQNIHVYFEGSYHIKCS